MATQYQPPKLCRTVEEAKSYAAANSPPAQPFQNVDSPQQLTDMYAIVKSHNEVQKDQDFRAKMKEALPTAAWAHSVPTLVDEEWNIRTCLYNELGPAGGVAYVRKDQVIRKSMIKAETR